jgi:hypothetical protein
MCEATTIGLIIGAVSAGLSAAQTNANNQAQKKAYQEQSRLNTEQAKNLQDQIDKKSQQEMSDRAKAAMAERAALRTASGEAGVGGAGVSILENQADRNASVDIATMETNRSNLSRQAALDAAGTAAAIQGKINSLPSEAAVWGQAGLQIAGQYANYAGKQQAGKSTLPNITNQRRPYTARTLK